MAYKITDACIACGACADGKFEINADECIECGACAGVCPVEAPIAD